MEAESGSPIHATYLSRGFTEYTPPGTHAPTLRFLERALL
jgi:hypothetical protein